MSKKRANIWRLGIRGGIAKYLAVSFVGMILFSVLTVVAVVILVNLLEANLTDALTRTDLAFHGAQMQNKSDLLMALTQRYISHYASQQERLDIRHQIALVRSQTEEMLAQAVAQTAGDDLTERTRLANIERKFVDLYLQVNRVLQTYDLEGDQVGQTTLMYHQLLQEYQASLTAEIDAFQAYETGRVQEAQASATNLIRLIWTTLPIIAILMMALTGLLTLRAFRRIILPLDQLNAGVAQLQAGHLEYQLPVRVDNEIGTLAATLNDLSAQLYQNIREIKQAEAAIRQLNTQLEQHVRERTAELEAANRELEAFAYSVSHDLRAPLRSIDGYSKLLLEDYCPVLDEQGQQYLHNVRLSAQRMSQLIDDLLKLSRVTRTEMNRTRVNLSELAEEALDELHARQPERAVSTLIQPELVVAGDLNLLRIMLENILGNAWKFTLKTPEARIEMGMLQRDGQAVYFVRDNGAGFDMKYADKLFGAFQRLHSIDEYEGTGIGLATVQRIINRHGGRVWAEGEPEQGATFYFTLQ